MLGHARHSRAETVPGQAALSSPRTVRKLGSGQTASMTSGGGLPLMLMAGVMAGSSGSGGGVCVWGDDMVAAGGGKSLMGLQSGLQTCAWTAAFGRGGRGRQAGRWLAAVLSALVERTGVSHASPPPPPPPWPSPRPQPAAPAAPAEQSRAGCNGVQMQAGPHLRARSAEQELGRVAGVGQIQSRCRAGRSSHAGKPSTAPSSLTATCSASAGRPMTSRRRSRGPRT